MKPLRILVAEDDVHIREGLEATLASEGYAVEAVADGEAALAAWRRERPALLILDIMMPGRNGYDVCRAIRAADARVPILMLSAKSEEIDKVLGLQLGADDYVTKPFGIHELLARVAAALRRTEAERAPAPAPAVTANGDFMVGPARVDVRRYRLVHREAECDISDRERRVLRCFHDHPGEVLSRDHLLNAVWGIDYFGTTRTLDQHVAQIRKKLAGLGADAGLIQTIHGVGYRLKATVPGARPLMRTPCRRK
jgi:DNA-binding response OmpR family regulator